MLLMENVVVQRATSKASRVGPVRSTRLYRFLTATDPLAPEDDAEDRLSYARAAAQQPSQQAIRRAQAIQQQQQQQQQSQAPGDWDDSQAGSASQSDQGGDQWARVRQAVRQGMQG